MAGFMSPLTSNSVTNTMNTVSAQAPVTNKALVGAITDPVLPLGWQHVGGPDTNKARAGLPGTATLGNITSDVGAKKPENCGSEMKCMYWKDGQTQYLVISKDQWTEGYYEGDIYRKPKSTPYFWVYKWVGQTHMVSMSSSGSSLLGDMLPGSGNDPGSAEDGSITSGTPSSQGGTPGLGGSASVDPAPTVAQNLADLLNRWNALNKAQQAQAVMAAVRAYQNLPPAKKTQVNNLLLAWYNKLPAAKKLAVRTAWAKAFQAYKANHPGTGTTYGASDDMPTPPGLTEGTKISPWVYAAGGVAIIFAGVLVYKTVN